MPINLTITACDIAESASQSRTTTSSTARTQTATTSTPGTQRSNVKPGAKVQIVLKQDQRTGKLTEGIVASLLTNSTTHPHGIKVKLQDGKVGRVQKVLGT